VETGAQDVDLAADVVGDAPVMAADLAGGGPVMAADLAEARRIIAADVAAAARAMAALELVTAFGHVSARHGDLVLMTPAAPLAGVSAADIVTLQLSRETAPPDAASHPHRTRPPHGAVSQPPHPASLPQGVPGEAWLHLAIYAARPDVRAIARGQPADALAAASVACELRPLHGQAAWLGPVIPVHDDSRLLRDYHLAAAAATTMTDADTEALLLRGNGAVTTADTPGLAVARMWLLAAACSIYLAASAAGQLRPLSSAEITSWRAVEGEMLPRVWDHLRYYS
jgi:HCOMODA/2-hydroxy-3-carboxy-muconic semialdehyde decarboxylase